MDSKIEERFQNIKKSKTFRNIVSTFSLDTKKVLDIGCSYGEFLIHFGPSSVGVTITNDEVEYGKKKGLAIRYGNIESPDFVLSEKFEVIFANNIFEHLYSPHEFLCQVKKYLEPEGVLILGVPCIPKIVSLLRLTKFRGSLAGAHINFFTRDTLIKTVERAGYDIIATQGFHFKNKIVDHLLDPIYPHLYVIATPRTNFKYSEKRMKELAGYTH
jgi:2-polyprenyl-3-methyl-5-hydroxy-6-metoxy-1,4-benzoquinol methylase